MNPKNKHLPWKGLSAQLGVMAANNQIPESAKESVHTWEAWLVATWKGFPKPSKSCVSSTFRTFGQKHTVEKVITPYTGILFDNDNIIIQVGEKTWAFSPEEWAQVQGMFSKLKQFS